MLDCFLFMPFLIINLRQFKILLAGLVPNPKSKIENPKLFDDLVRPRQHIGRNHLTILDFGLPILDYGSSENSVRSC
jgi:hypothetical protein